MKLGLPFSIAVLFWMAGGVVRAFIETKLQKKTFTNEKLINENIKKVAICLPAHNEEKVIKSTIKSIKRQLPTNQIYVVSDGSVDKTFSIAKRLKCNVIKITPGAGKARALKKLIVRFNLLNHYRYLLFVDADIVLGANFIKNALRIFLNNSDVAVIAGYIKTPWKRHSKNMSIKRFIAAYRVRLNTLLQALLVYGQSWKPINNIIVAPGACSMYRSETLKRIRLDTPGLLIEDFNLTFQIHKKRLGKIAHYPNIYVFDKEPKSIKDYYKQVKRWNIGYFQTIRKQGIWVSLFWIMVGLFTLEVFLNASTVILLPFALLLLTSDNFTIFREMFLFFFIYDYSLTILVAMKSRKLNLLLYGIGFPLFRYLDSLILVSSIPIGLFSKSKGLWEPPKRS